MDYLYYFIIGFLASIGYKAFKRILSKYISNWYLLRTFSLLTCIGIGVAITYILKIMLGHVNS